MHPNAPSIEKLKQTLEDLEKESRPDQRKLSALRYQIRDAELYYAESEQSEQSEELVDETKSDTLDVKKAEKKKKREAKSQGSKRKHAP